jgi:purine-binding chemotaxis protein CheW
VEQFLLFRIDGMRLAVLLTSVERVVRMVEVTPVPQSPDWVAGIVNCRGEPVPVLDLHRWCGLKRPGYRPSDSLILITLDDRRAALPVNEVEDVVPMREDDLRSLREIVPGMESEELVGILGENLVFIYDPASLIAPSGPGGEPGHAGG